MQTMHRGPWLATGQETPVFLDHSGRRRHLVAAFGALMAALTTAWLVALVIGGLGFGTLPSAPGLPLATVRRVPRTFDFAVLRRVPQARLATYRRPREELTAGPARPDAQDVR